MHVGKRDVTVFLSLVQLAILSLFEHDRSADLSPVQLEYQLLSLTYKHGILKYSEGRDAPFQSQIQREQSGADRRDERGPNSALPSAMHRGASGTPSARVAFHHQEARPPHSRGAFGAWLTHASGIVCIVICLSLRTVIAIQHVRM